MQRNLLLITAMAIAACGGGDATSAKNSDDGVGVSESSSVPPEITTAITDWSRCRVSKVRDFVSSARSDEAVVDDALSECMAHERRTIDLWERFYGAGSGGQVQDLRARWREGLIANVRQIRAGTPPTADDPAGAWGICVGRNLPDPPPTTVAPQAIVEAALNACTAEMSIARTYYAQRYGDAVADAQIEQSKSQFRRLGLQMLEERRASR
jgi:hypothetical protein